MLSDDLHNMLAAELESLEVEQDAINNRRDAIKLLLGERDDDMPAATFTAHDAERHVERKGGSKNRADITDAQLRDIRERAKTQSHAKLATEFNISRATVGNIVRRKGCYA